MRIHWNRVAALLMFPIISSWLLVGTHQSSVPALPLTTTTVVVQPLPRVVVTTTTTLPLALTRWDTRSTDPTASWPDADDPTWDLPLGAQITFACIRYLESRNHTFSVNVQSSAGGWYQFMPHIWWYARQHIPGLPASARLATPDQQSAVAVWYYKRNNGFAPEWRDHCDQ